MFERRKGVGQGGKREGMHDCNCYSWLRFLRLVALYTALWQIAAAHDDSLAHHFDTLVCQLQTCQEAVQQQGQYLEKP